jgi:hypothetical protein
MTDWLLWIFSSDLQAVHPTNYRILTHHLIIQMQHYICMIAANRKYEMNNEPSNASE